MHSVAAIRMLVLVGTACLCVEAQVASWREEGANYRLERFEVQVGELTVDNIERIAAKQIRLPNQDGFFLSQFYVRPADRCLLQPKGYHWSFSIWAVMYDACRQYALTAAEVVSWRKGTVLRVRTADGHFVRRVLAGSDPLLVKHENIPVHIVYFAFPRAMLPMRDERVEVYAISDRVVDGTDGDREGVFRELTKLLPFKEVYAWFRKDSQFVEEEHFPIVAPFDSWTSEPTKRGIDTTTTVYCTPLRAKAPCGSMTRSRR